MTISSAATFTRRQFMVYERVMGGRAHDQASLEVDAVLGKDTAPDAEEKLSWAQWSTETTTASSQTN